jgi:hypothetical protein
MIVPVSVVEIGSRSLLHLLEIHTSSPGGLEQIAAKKAKADTLREQRGAALAKLVLALLLRSQRRTREIQGKLLRGLRHEPNASATSVT